VQDESQLQEVTRQLGAGSVIGAAVP